MRPPAKFRTEFLHPPQKCRKVNIPPGNDDAFAAPKCCNESVIQYRRDFFVKKYYDLCILGATAYAAGVGGKSFFKKISFF